MAIVFTKSVHPINFSILSGHEFERLVFATLLRMHSWHTLDWIGQSGGDQGRDIIGTRDNEFGQSVVVVIACANWKVFSSGKGISDITKFIKELNNPPHEIIIVASNSVSASIKDKCNTHARSLGVSVTQVWSGAELEEQLRFHAASVLQRFIRGEELPDEPAALRSFVQQLEPSTEVEAGKLIARLFDRPAFTTRIQGESSLPAFRQALGDTIGALNTGIWRDREGAIISRVPSYQTFPTKEVQFALGNCVKELTSLRLAFDEGLRSSSIRPCGCNKSDCPVFSIEPEKCEQLEKIRRQAIKFANEALAVLGIDPIGCQI